MRIRDMLANVAAAVMPRKSVEQMIEEQNTRTVWYPRAYGRAKRYVYGKVPGKPVVELHRSTEGRVYPHCAAENDAEVVRWHREVCRSETGSSGGLCDMCKKLSNPKRFDLMVRLYREVLDGACVTNAQDGSGLYLAATSTYLRQLFELGLLRRERNGKFVNYYPDFSGATEPVGEIARLIMRRLRNESGDLSFTPIFRSMMSPLLAGVVRRSAAGEVRSVGEIAEKLNMRVGDLRVYLKPAVEGGLISIKSDDPDGVYEYITPADPIARRIVELS